MDISDYIPSEFLKTSLVGLLLVVGVSVGFFVFTPTFPSSIVALNEAGDTIATIAGLACGLLCCPGLLCIWIHKLRFPMIIILSFILLLFLSAAAVNAACENLSYAMVKTHEPEKHLCTITQKGRDGNYNQLTFKVHDTDEEYTIDSSSSDKFFYRVEEGDVCVVYILKGGIGIDFLVDMRVKSRSK